MVLVSASVGVLNLTWGKVTFQKGALKRGSITMGEVLKKGSITMGEVLKRGSITIGEVLKRGFITIGEVLKRLSLFEQNKKHGPTRPSALGMSDLI